MNILTEGIPEGNDILLESITCTYVQDVDCTDEDDGYQKLILSTRDGGGGKFINIKTDSWSIDSVDDLCKLIKHFERLYENTSNS